jgi:hypothetical protein
MRGQAYRTKRFRAAKEYLRDNYEDCWVTDDNGKCRRRGTIPDHQPPLADFPDHMLWNGILLPMCKYHSDKQSGMMRHGRNVPAPSRQW